MARSDIFALGTGGWGCSFSIRAKKTKTPMIAAVGAADRANSQRDRGTLSLGGVAGLAPRQRRTPRGAEELLLRFFWGLPPTSCRVHAVTIHCHIWSNCLVRETLRLHALRVVSAACIQASKAWNFLWYLRNEDGGQKSPLTGPQRARSNRLPQAVVVFALGTPQPLVEWLWTTGRRSGKRRGFRSAQRGGAARGGRERRRTCGEGPSRRPRGWSRVGPVRPLAW